MSPTFDLLEIVLPDRVELMDPVSWVAASELIKMRSGGLDTFASHIARAVELCSVETAAALKAMSASNDLNRRSRLCLLAAASTSALPIFVQEPDGRFRKVSEAAWRCSGEAPINPLCSALTGRLATIAPLMPGSCDAARLSGASLFLSRKDIEVIVRTGLSGAAAVLREVQRLVEECIAYQHLPAFDDFFVQLRAAVPKVTKSRLRNYWKPPTIPVHWQKRGRRPIESRPPNWLALTPRVAAKSACIKRKKKA